MRPFKIHSLCNLQIHNTMLLTVVTFLYITSLWLIYFVNKFVAFHSVQFSRSILSDSLWPHRLQHARLPCPSPTPGACSNSRRVGDATQPSHPLSSTSPAFTLSQHQGLFQWVSSLHQVSKVLELQLQHSPSSEYSGLISFELAGLFSVLSKGLSKVFSNTTVQKHQFFRAQLSS